MADAAWTKDLEIGIRIWIERSGKAVLGKGRVELLAAIGRTESISAAAREMKMSYRHAWNMVQEINERAGTPLVAAAVGGKRGGGASLTEEGRQAIELYRAIQKTIADHSAAVMKRSLEEAGSTASSTMSSKSDSTPGSRAKTKSK